MERDTIIQTLLVEKILVIVRGVAPEKLLPLAEALYAGGIRVMEVTYSADGSVDDAAAARCVQQLAAHFGERMLIGSGTVLKPEQVRRTAAAGGRFIVSPNTDPAVIGETVAAGLVSIPGALTPTEIQAAHAAGADLVKLFPAGCMGAEYLKTVHLPLSHIPLLAVGGIKPGELGAYLAAGAAGFGISSGIVDKALVAAGDYAGITRRAAAYVAEAKGLHTL